MESNIFNTPIKKEAKVFTETDYVTYKVVQKVQDGFDPKKPSEFLLIDEVVEDTRVPIEDDINCHRNRVGLKNLLSGIVSQKQMNALIEKTRSDGQFIDLTKFPDSHLAIEELAGSIDSIWDKIPSELKGSLTKDEFVKTMTSKKLEAYILSEVAKLDAASKEKGDEK